MRKKRKPVPQPHVTSDAVSKRRETAKGKASKRVAARAGIARAKAAKLIKSAGQ